MPDDPKPGSIKSRHRKLKTLARDRFADLTKGELKLLQAVAAGEMADLSPGQTKPPDPQQQVRAKFLRWLLVDPAAHALFDRAEVWLRGAVVTGKLDLEHAVIPVAVVLWKCSIDGGILLRDARTQTINLAGSRVRGVGADALFTRGSLLLKNGFSSKGEVRLIGAQIGGELNCRGGTFHNSSGTALNAQSMRVGHALLLEAAEIDGLLDLESAAVRTLVDDAKSWPRRIDLHNFRYEEIAAGAPLDARRRLDWLDRQDPDRVRIPNPQPYRHLAAVLSRQGHDDEARRVMIGFHWRRMWRSPKIHWKDRQYRTAAVDAAMVIPRLLFGAIAGFGYGRWRALGWLIGIFVLGAIVFGWHGGARMKISQAYALRSRTVLDGINKELAALQKQCKNDSPKASALRTQRKEYAWVDRYPGFNPWVYSVDALIPVFDLHQEAYWTPKDGWVRWWYLPGHVAAGWIVTTLFVVSLTGLVRRSGDD